MKNIKLLLSIQISIHLIITIRSIDTKYQPLKIESRIKMISELKSENKRLEEKLKLTDKKLEKTQSRTDTLENSFKKLEQAIYQKDAELKVLRLKLNYSGKAQKKAEQNLRETQENLTVCEIHFNSTKIANKKLEISLSESKSQTEECTLKSSACKKEIARLSENEELCTLPPTCDQLLSGTGNTEGSINKLSLQTCDIKPFYTYCLPNKNDSRTWTVIMRRLDASEDFFRPWRAYKKGFGNVSSSFFLGLEKLHLMTQIRPHGLWISLMDFKGEKRHAKYDAFAIGNETEQFYLKTLGRYSGDAGDALKFNRGAKFSTKGHDSTELYCTKIHMGGWWYNSCGKSNLNGIYRNETQKGEKNMTGINWWPFNGKFYSMQFAEMAIRPMP